MKKIRYLKIFVAVVIMISVISATLLLLVPRREIYNYLYEQQELEARTGMSAFEAELNYDGMIQQILGNQEITGMTTVGSSADLNNKLLRLQRIYRCAKWICGMGILLSVAGLIVLRNQKWYEVLNLGGLITMGISLLIAGISLLVRPCRLFILESRYEEYLGYDPLLVGILPEHWAFYTWLFGVGVVFLIGVLFLLLHLGSRKSYKPHKF
ncbi:MAG: DUF1461 domain-containing protein [Bacteroides sp.]|nr:DUF1461 domain-containing protein [Bacteroides sp.]MCM1550654.1 DUF1461 domain-containing protein [Clostridium sp.]